MYILHINKISLIVIIARKIDLFDTSIGVFHFQNLKMMFLNQIANRMDFGFHHFQDHCSRRKFKTLTCMFDRGIHYGFFIRSAFTVRTQINRSRATHRNDISRNSRKRSSDFLLERANSTFALRSRSSSSAWTLIRLSS